MNNGKIQKTTKKKLTKFLHCFVSICQQILFCEYIHVDIQAYRHNTSKHKISIHYFNVPTLDLNLKKNYFYFSCIYIRYLYILNIMMIILCMPKTDLSTYFFIQSHSYIQYLLIDIKRGNWVILIAPHIGYLAWLDGSPPPKNNNKTKTLNNNNILEQQLMYIHPFYVF